jgi:hypothetical protein
MHKVLALALLASVAACSSYESTAIQQANGIYSKGPKMDGFVTRIPVPTYAFKATDTYYRMPDGSVALDHEVSDTPIELISYALFATDIKRPISGTAKTNVTFSDHAITTMSSDVVDTTLTDLAGIISELAKLKEAPGGAGGNPDLAGVFADSRVDSAPRNGRAIGRNSYYYVYDSLSRTWGVSPTPGPAHADIALN